MISKAKAKFIRISPRKTRDVIDLIRGKKVRDALDILKNLNKGTTKPVIKLLKSAVSNAKPLASDEDNLYISKITADNGPMLKRYRSAAFGRAVMIRHRLCHIVVELNERKKSLPLKAKKAGTKTETKKKTKSKTKKITKAVKE